MCFFFIFSRDANTYPGGEYDRMMLVAITGATERRSGANEVLPTLPRDRHKARRELPKLENQRGGCDRLVKRMDVLRGKF